METAAFLQLQAEAAAAASVEEAAAACNSSSFISSMKLNYLLHYW